jgi:hypothetical protein
MGDKDWAVVLIIMSEQDLGEQLAYERERAEKAEAEIERY